MNDSSLKLKSDSKKPAKSFVNDSSGVLELWRVEDECKRTIVTCSSTVA